MSLTKQQKVRSDNLRKTILRRYLVALAILVGYYAEIKLIGFELKCPFRAITGLRCPGCGVSRMFLHLSHAEFSAAFNCNQVLFFLVPLFAVTALIKVIWLPEVLMPQSKYYRLGVVFIIVILLAFGVLRNVFDF